MAWAIFFRVDAEVIQPDAVESLGVMLNGGVAVAFHVLDNLVDGLFRSDIGAENFGGLIDHGLGERAKVQGIEAGEYAAGFGEALDKVKFH